MRVNTKMNLLKPTFRERFWQAMFYLGWSIVAIWTLLKSLEIIHTPVWLEYGVPLLGLLIGALALYTAVMDKITMLSVNLATLNASFIHVEKDIEALKMEDKEIYRLLKRA